VITVKLLAVLKELAPEGNKDGIVELEHTPGMTVADALAATDIVKTDIKYSVMVNNVRSAKDSALKDGDIIKVMPLLAGG